jgi:hypothetical protein
MLAMRAPSALNHTGVIVMDAGLLNLSENTTIYTLDGFHLSSNSPYSCQQSPARDPG